MAQGRFFTLLGLLLILAVGAHHALDRASRAPAPPAVPQRIVSLAPAITETLYALGLGKAVVGVTRYCEYPPEVAMLPQVAGFSEVNYEGVLRVRPDLIVIPADRARDRLLLERLGLPVLALDTLSVSGLLRGIAVLGRATGKAQAAETLTASLEKALTAARKQAEGRTKPRVLFSVMRSYQGLGYIAELHAVGHDGFYSELIELAGGQNVYQGDLAFPRLSREALLFLNPEIIIDVVPGRDDSESAYRDWQSLASISAIKNKRVFVLSDQAHTVPGPRFVQTLSMLSRAFHPEPATP